MFLYIFFKPLITFTNLRPGLNFVDRKFIFADLLCHKAGEDLSDVFTDFVRYIYNGFILRYDAAGIKPYLSLAEQTLRCNYGDCHLAVYDLLAYAILEAES